MCYSVSLTTDREELEQRFSAQYLLAEQFKVIYHSSAFSLPQHPVITDEFEHAIQLYDWGIMPHWAKDAGTATSIRRTSANARCETLFEKPVFKSPAKYRHCLVLVNGFFDWMEQGGRKYPHLIRKKDNSPFALAGLWDNWTDGNTEHVTNTFTVITTTANPLLEKIHNTKKRMPVILERDDEKNWLKGYRTHKESESFLKPYSGLDLVAIPVSDIISRRNVNSNVPEAIEPFDYPDLHLEQSKLF